jgi:hypothetical protein
MAKLSAQTSMAARLDGAVNLAKAVLAINAASAATVKTTNALTYLLDGIMYSKSALSAQALTFLAALNGMLTAFYTQPASTTVYYLLVVDKSGNVYCVQGTYAGQNLGVGLSVVGDGTVPDVDTSTYCPFGIIKIVTDSSHTFVPGTTALDATGITATYFDIACIPANDKP